MIINKKKKRPGFSLVEVLLAIAIFALISTSIIYLLIDAGTTNHQNQDRVVASALADEGMEATRAIRDANWSNLQEGTHGLINSDNHWQFSGASDIDPTNRFTRQITISMINTDRFQIISTITWQSLLGFESSISASSYLTNWRKDTTVVAPPPPWIQPKTLGVVGYLDINSNGNRNPNSIFVLGNYAYFGTDTLNNVGAEFYVFNITDPAKPLLVGNCVIGAQIKAVDVVGNYAYLATGDPNAELTILDVTNPANPQKVSGVNLPGNATAKDIAIAGNHAYLTTNNNPSGEEFYVIDITDPLHPVSTPVSNLELGADANAISVSGNFAYIGTSDDSKEIQIVDISNPASPIIVKTYDNPGSADVNDILVNNNTLYLATTNNGTIDPDFVILTIDTSNPSQVSITKIGQMQLAGDVNGLALDSADNQMFLATSVTNKQFFLADITNPALPTEKASLSLPDTAISLVFNGIYVYVADIANGKELIIIGPG